MSTPPPLKAYTCPTCGAPLEIDPDEPVLHCRYCQAIVDNPEYVPPQPEIQPEVIYLEQPLQIPHPSKKARPAIFLVVVGLLVLAIGGAAFLVVMLLSGPGINLFPLRIYSPSMLLNTSSTPPDIISVTYNEQSDNYALSRLSMADHKALWSALKQDDYLSVDAMLAGDTLLYVIIDDHLSALQLSDGQVAWEATLPDKIYPPCNTCLLMQKGQVIVYTLDRSLGAFDALTGHQSWEKNFESAGYILFPLKDQVGLLYGAGRGSVLGIIDPLTGDEVTRIDPLCQPAEGLSDELANYSRVVFDSTAQSPKAYLLFGFFNACVQRWDLANGTLEWKYIEEDSSLDNPRETNDLLVDGRLIYVEDDQLRVLDAATGTNPQVLDENKNYDLVPLTVSGKYLLVRAKRTSGSTRFELWGYNLETGQNLWKRPLLDSSPLDPPDVFGGLIDKGETGFTYKVTSDGVWLITFQASPHQINLAQINLATGELSNQKSISLNLDTTMDFYSVPTGIPSQDQLAWFKLEDKIYAIDLVAGDYAYRCP